MRQTRYYFSRLLLIIFILWPLFQAPLEASLKEAPDGIRVYDSRVQGAQRAKFFDDHYKVSPEEDLLKKVGSGKYLAYRDIAPWLKKMVSRFEAEGARSPRALDYGAGTGISAKYLKMNGFDPVGVDIDPNMLEMARANFGSEGIEFLSMKVNQIPFPDKTFDLVFSAYVLLEMETKEKMISYLKEARRVMRDDASFVAFTSSEDLYSVVRQWSGLKVDFDENKELRSGSTVCAESSRTKIKYIDHYWTTEDYIEVFRAAGLKVCELHFPLGRDGEIYEWRDEVKISPVILIRAAKECR